MSVLDIRKVMNESIEGIRDNIKSSHDIKYEDGVIIHQSRVEIILNRYLMDILIPFPDVPYLSKYHIGHQYKNNQYVKSTINKTHEVMYKDIIFIVIDRDGDRHILDKVFEHMYSINNRIFNEVVYTHLHHASTTLMSDFLDIQLEPVLMSAIDEVRTKQDLASVKNVYNVLDAVIRGKSETNVIAKNYLSETINPNQVKQMLGCVGFGTELDSTIFKYPIASSFTLGMNNIYELAVASRAGAKALFLSNRAIQESEYFAREMQLVAMHVEKLIDGDCGNTDYVEWLVRDSSHTGKPDLKNLIGKYYFNEKTKKLDIITMDDTHLIGTTIKLRSAINCKLSNKRHICTKCFGRISYAIHDHSSLGHYCTTGVTKMISQSILSTKHLTSSAVSGNIVLDDISKRFFSIKGKNGYAFRANVLNKARSKMLLTVSQECAYGLKDINNDTNIYKLNIARVSRVDNIAISVVSENSTEVYPIRIKNGNKLGNFTKVFLKHVKDHGYSLNDRDEYVIDLKEFNNTTAIIEMPDIEFNFLELAKNIKKEFKYMKVVKGEYSVETQESFLQKVFDIVNYKLDINIALLEVIVYAFSVYNYKNDDYDLGRNSDDVQLASISSIMGNRTVSAGYAWEDVRNIMINPKSFDSRNNVDHVLDVMLKPAETLEWDKRQN